MPRRLLLFLALAPLMACRPEAPPPRNLLLISIDTLRADHVGAYGAQGVQTPNLDRLAREGARFAAMSSAVPLTLPSHATLLTGLLPPLHGLRVNGAGRLPPDVPTLAERLSSAGFDTAAFVGAFVLDHRFGLDRGFAVYDDAVAREAGGQAPRLEAERPANEVVDRALAWLGQRPRGGAQGFFLFVHLYDAHAPYAPPEPWRSRFAGRPYDGEIAFADAQLGRLLEALAARGELDATLVAAVADHGESLGEHGEDTHGLLLYEPALHVPLLLRSPGRVPAGQVVSSEASLVDLAPTLAALLGQSWPTPGQPTAGQPAAGELTQGRGRDLSPLLAGGSLPPRPVYAETEYPAAFGWSPLAAARENGKKLILSPRPALFDLAADPGEKQDRKDAERRALRGLEETIAELRAAARPVAAGEIDPESRRQLASLGYAAPAPGPTRQIGQGAHPEDRLADFRRWELVEEESRGGRRREAAQALAALVEADPGNPVFRASLARLARDLGDHALALGLYRRALADAPGDADTWQDLAAAFHEMGQSRESAAAVSQALALDPRRPEALVLLALAELAEGRPAAAEERLAAALALDPRSAHAHLNLGNLRRDRGDLAGAEAAYRRALELAPGLADGWNGLGALAIAADRPREAAPFFARAIELEPDFAAARLNYGIALQLAGDEAGARRVFEDLLRRTAGLPRYAAERQAALKLLDLQHP